MTLIHLFEKEAGFSDSERKIYIHRSIIANKSYYCKVYSGYIAGMEALTEVGSETELWMRIEKRIRANAKDTPVIDGTVVCTYEEHDNPNYSRGMFMDTVCKDAKVLDYCQMKESLETLAHDYEEEAQIFKVGESEGYGSSDNSRTIWGLRICPDWKNRAEKAEKTVLFVAGHHFKEFSGPLTVYEIGGRFLESYRSGKYNVREMLKNAEVILIPQVDVDGYDNLDKADDPDYFLNGYSRLIDTANERQRRELKSHEMNIYDENYYVDPLFGLMFRQTLSVKSYVDGLAGSGEPPYLSFDFHEGSCTGKYEIMKELEGGMMGCPSFFGHEIRKVEQVPHDICYALLSNRK